MKRKKLLCILLAAAAVLCAVLFRRPGYSEPPELTVRSGEETLTVPGSATSWEYQKFGGGWVSYEASLKPVNLQGGHPALESTGETVTLEFDVEPDRLWVSRYWTSPAEMDVEGTEIDWKLNGNELELDGGRCLYEIKVRWSVGDKKWGGNATYYFYAVGPGKTMLTKPPELTVWSDKQTITALKGTSSWHYGKRNGKGIESDSGPLSELRAQAPVIECGDGVAIAVLEFPQGAEADVITVSADGRAAKPLDTNWLELDSGTHFYEVRAEWYGDGSWGGSCYYYFHAIG